MGAPDFGTGQDGWYYSPRLKAWYFANRTWKALTGSSNLPLTSGLIEDDSVAVVFQDDRLVLIRRKNQTFLSPHYRYFD